MPDAFFANSKKRKRPQANTRHAGKSSVNGKSKPKTQQKESRRKRDEELSDGEDNDIDDLDLRASDVDPNESDKEEYSKETPAQKRLRLAKVYLDSVKKDLATVEGEYDAAEIDREIISSRLKEDVLEHAGKLHIHIADTLNLNRGTISRLRVKSHRLAVTAAVLSGDSNFLYTSGKEGAISCYDILSGKRICHLPKLRRENKGKGKARDFDNDVNGHTDEILALAISGDGRFLVSGGRDKRIGVWTIANSGQEEQPLTWLKGLTGHKDTISGLSFRKSTNVLYSSSFDRTVKLFDLSLGVMGYVETLFGHQEAITDIDSLKGDTTITTAGRDRTVRFWKITEESQLVFRGGGLGNSKMRDLLETGLELSDEEEFTDRKRKNVQTWVEGSIDCVAMIDENTFLSGGDSGSISLWATTKKKPVFTYPTAHGLEEIESSTEGKLRRPRWITSIGCLRYGDIFASGSWDGYIRLWKVHSSLRSFAPLGTLGIHGILNSLKITVIPKDWFLDKSWPKQAMQTGVDEDSQPNGLPESEKQGPTHTLAAGKDQGILVTAAVGQEPRLGRWIKLKGDDTVNCGVIFAIRSDIH